MNHPQGAHHRIQRVEGVVMPVNSYIVAGTDGLVVVDGQLTVSDARALRAAVDSYGLPVVALVLTHGHPDHYAGASVLLDGLDAPIVATGGVDAVIRRDDAEKDTVVGAMMGDEWPVERRFPDQIVDDGAELQLGGLQFVVRDLGPAESHFDSVWILDEQTIFAGDVAYNEMHAYLADGRFAEWLQVLDRLGAELADGATLHVGHGEPTGAAVLRRQRTYVEAFVEAVDASRGLGVQERHDAVVARMREIVPGDDLLFLMELSIEPVLAAMEAAS